MNDLMLLSIECETYAYTRKSLSMRIQMVVKKSTVDFWYHIELNNKK